MAKERKTHDLFDWFSNYCPRCVLGSKSVCNLPNPACHATIAANISNTGPSTAEARQHALNQILHPEAADRLGRIRMVKESRATDIENRLIMLAQSGQLRSKVTEEQLKDLLNAVAENNQKQEEKIVVNRRKAWEDEDDDLFDL